MTSVPAQPSDDGATVPGPPGRRSGNALADGARLGEFEIRGVIGEGGFGIVYLAWDGSLQRQVAIKEYMPATLAARVPGSRVMPRTDKVAETFALGLRSFVNEAQLLASFDHPSLLKVYRFWEANGTAYMVMPYYRGKTLKRALQALGAPPEEGWLLRRLGPLLDALDVMHRAHCYHRDIAPDNILLLDNDTPLLLDFGAARRVIGDATHALTAFLKPGYAPVEQYAEMPSMKQGPWTDLYALASVVHYAITGRTPPESVARLVNDAMVPLATVAEHRYSQRFLRAIDHALAVRPEDRPQSAAEMRDELGIEQQHPRVRKLDRNPTASLALEPKAAVRDDVTMPPPAPVPTSPAATPRLRVLETDPTQITSRPGWRVAPRWWWTGALALVVAAAAAWWGLIAAGPDTVEPRSSAEVPTDGGTTAAPANSAPPVPAVTTTAAPAPAVEPAGPPTSAQPPADVAPTRTAEVPVADGERASSAPTPSARPTPRKYSPSPRCTEIIARVSLGEPLSPQEEAILKGECRK